MNDIRRGTTNRELEDHLLVPPHWLDEEPLQPDQLPDRFTCTITDSRLDDELSVAVIEFTDTPKWLRLLNLNPVGFPKKTTIGTLWPGVNTTSRDEQGQTEFMRAAFTDNLLYSEALAEFADTDINVQDIHGRTALHWACAGGRPNIVMLCLSVPGCDVGLRDEDGLTAFDIARQNGAEFIPNLFYKSMLDLDEIDPQAALLRVLTLTSQPAEARPVFPGTALFEPVRERNEALVQALISRGVDLTARDSGGDTPLHVAAAQVGSTKIAKLLLEAGSDVAATGGGGGTPLHSAARTADAEMIDVLLDWGADVTGEDSSKQTALHWAVQSGKLDVARVLLEHGADAEARDNAGQTALKLAEEKQLVNVVGLLEEWKAAVVLEQELEN